MAERLQPHQLQVHQQRPSGAVAAKPPAPRTPIAKTLAVITVLPIGGTILALSGMALFGSLVGLAVATPVFVIFSPVIVPAAAVIALAVASFMASCVFGLAGISSLNSFVGYLRLAAMVLPRNLELAKQRLQDVAGQVGQKTKDLGPTRAQEGPRSS